MGCPQTAGDVSLKEYIVNLQVTEYVNIDSH
jgi:hypothetical protein